MASVSTGSSAVSSLAGKKMDVDVKFTRTVAIIRLTANEGGLRRGTDFQIAAKSTGKNYHPWVP